MAEETYLTSPEWLEHLAARKANSQALDKHYQAVRNTAYHTQECATATEQVVVQARLVGFYVGESIKDLKERLELAQGRGRRG